MEKVEREVLGILSTPLVPIKRQSHEWGEAGRGKSESVPPFTFSRSSFKQKPTAQP